MFERISFFRFHLKAETTPSHENMLTNEYFRVTTRIDNENDILVEDVSLSITIPKNLLNKGICSFDLLYESVTDLH